MHKFLRNVSLFAFFTVFGVAAANAQSVTEVSVNVPFAFSVGNTDLAAGEYDVRIFKNSAGGAAITLSQKGGDGQWSVFALSNGDSAAGRRAELTFDRVDTQRVLRRIALDGSGLSITGSGNRIRLAKDNMDVDGSARGRRTSN